MISRCGQPRDRSPRPAQALRRSRGRTRDRFQRRPGRGVRTPGSERGREDDHGGDPRGVPPAVRGRGERPRARPEAAPGELGAGDTPRDRGARRNGRRLIEQRETDDPTALLHELTSAALERGERLRDRSVTRPSLEDVYLELTGDG